MIWRVVSPGARPSVPIKPLGSSSTGDRIVLPEALKEKIRAATPR